MPINGESLLQTSPRNFPLRDLRRRNGRPGAPSNGQKPDDRAKTSFFPCPVSRCEPAPAVGQCPSARPSKHLPWVLPFRRSTHLMYLKAPPPQLGPSFCGKHIITGPCLFRWGRVPASKKKRSRTAVRANYQQGRPRWPRQKKRLSLNHRRPPNRSTARNGRPSYRDAYSSDRALLSAFDQQSITRVHARSTTRKLAFSLSAVDVSAGRRSPTRLRVKDSFRRPRHP